MNKIREWFDTKLIPEWRQALSFLSVQWALICVVAAPIWDSLSDEQKASILGILGIKPSWYVVAGVVIAIYLRLKAQKG